MTDSLPRRTIGLRHVSKVRLVIFLAIGISALSACVDPPAHWIDEARLHDGRTLEVRRTVYYNWSLPHSSPDQFAFTVTHPDTGETIKWKGPRWFGPVLIDFAGGVAYTVMVQHFTLGNLKSYGCPEIPYVFMRYDRQTHQWSQISASTFPRELLTANLSPDYTSYTSTLSDRRSAESIREIIKTWEITSDGSVTRQIPTNFAEWRSKYKNQWRVSHESDGCADTVPSNEDPTHIQSVGQSSQSVALEVLEDKTYSPELVITGYEQLQSGKGKDMSFDEALDARCNALLKHVGDDTDRPELRGWYLFVNDPTGNKKARKTAGLFCDDNAVWFVDYAMEGGRTVLTKFTITGDPVYRMSFAKPDLGGFILQPTFRRAGGYFYFDWVNGRRFGTNWTIAHRMKVRVLEPERASHDSAPESN
jgi:hypothetical protein